MSLRVIVGNSTFDGSFVSEVPDCGKVGAGPDGVCGQTEDACAKAVPMANRNVETDRLFNVLFPYPGIREPSAL